MLYRCSSAVYPTQLNASNVANDSAADIQLGSVFAFESAATSAKSVNDTMPIVLDDNGEIAEMETTKATDVVVDDAPLPINDKFQFVEGWSPTFYK